MREFFFIVVILMALFVVNHIDTELTLIRKELEKLNDNHDKERTNEGSGRCGH